jgi:hypothetical protein
MFVVYAVLISCSIFSFLLEIVIYSQQKLQPKTFSISLCIELPTHLDRVVFMHDFDEFLIMNNANYTSKQVKFM